MASVNRRPRVPIVSLTGLLLALLTASAAFGAVGGHLRNGPAASAPTCDTPPPAPTVDEGATGSGSDARGTEAAEDCSTAEPSVEPSVEPTAEPTATETETQ